MLFLRQEGDARDSEWCSSIRKGTPLVSECCSSIRKAMSLLTFFSQMNFIFYEHFGYELLAYEQFHTKIFHTNFSIWTSVPTNFCSYEYFTYGTYFIPYGQLHTNFSVRSFAYILFSNKRYPLRTFPYEQLRMNFKHANYFHTHFGPKFQRPQVDWWLPGWRAGPKPPGDKADPHPCDVTTAGISRSPLAAGYGVYQWPTTRLPSLP